MDSGETEGGRLELDLGLNSNPATFLGRLTTLESVPLFVSWGQMWGFNGMT